MMAVLEAPGVTMDKVMEKDYRSNSSEHVERFLAVRDAKAPRAVGRARLAFAR
jgi:hypothetical protein